MGLNYRMYGKVQMGTQFNNIEFESGLGTFTNDAHLNIMERQIVVAPGAIQAQDIAMYTSNQKLEALIALINRGTSTRATSIFNYIYSIYKSATIEVPVTEFIPVPENPAENFMVNDRLGRGVPGLGRRDNSPELNVEWVALNTSGRVYGPRTKELLAELYEVVWQELYAQLEDDTSFEFMQTALEHLVMATDANTLLSNQYMQGRFWLNMLRAHLREEGDQIGRAVAGEYIHNLSRVGHDNAVSDEYLIWYTMKLMGRVLDAFPRDVFYVRVANTEPNFRLYLNLKDFIYLLHAVKLLLEMSSAEVNEVPNLTVWYMESTNRRWSMALTPPRREINWQLARTPWQYRGIALHPWRYTGIAGVETQLTRVSDRADEALEERQVIGTTLPIGRSALGIKHVVAPPELDFNAARDVSVRVMESTSYAPVLFNAEDFNLGTNGQVLGLNVNTIGQVIQALFPDPYRHATLGKALGDKYRQDGNILWDYQMNADHGAEWPSEDITSIVPIIFA